MVQARLYWTRFVRRNHYALRQLTTLGVTFVVVLALLSPFAGHKAEEEVAVATPAAPVEAAAFEPKILHSDLLNSPMAQKDPVVAARAAATQNNSGLVSEIQARLSSMLEAAEETAEETTSSEKKVVVGRGDTLMGVLTRKAGLQRDDAYQVVQALSKVYNPRDINPGREITVFFHKDPALADPKFSGVRIEKDVVNVVNVKKDSKGKYAAKKAEKTVKRTLKAYKGTIDTSLYSDAKQAGVPDAVIADMIKMYSWNVDFQRDLHVGDKFEVMYEEYRTEDNKRVPGKGNIIYAKLALSGELMPFYRFEDKTGDVDYYDDKGRSAKKPLMKTPIDGARLSSGFGMRQHPVLGFTKMHKGVDFAAPTGTPIYAAGDGTVVKSGPFSSFGNYVRVRHRNGLETAYAHMSRIKAHMGERVKQGEVIGYVGTTGRVTGAHLHYEVLVNNAQVNPNSVKLPTGRWLKGNELKTFQNVMGQTKTKFVGIAGKTTVATAPTKKKTSEKIARN